MHTCGYLCACRHKNAMPIPRHERDLFALVPALTQTAATAAAAAAPQANGTNGDHTEKTDKPPQAAAAADSMVTDTPETEAVNPPNRILFATKLPADCTQERVLA